MRVQIFIQFWVIFQPYRIISTLLVILGHNLGWWLPICCIMVVCSAVILWREIIMGLRLYESLTRTVKSKQDIYYMSIMCQLYSHNYTTSSYYTFMGIWGSFIGANTSRNWECISTHSSVKCLIRLAIGISSDSDDSSKLLLRAPLAVSHPAPPDMTRSEPMSQHAVSVFWNSLNKWEY